MVAGVHKSLEEGRTYSYEELSGRFGLAGREFQRVLDQLVERGRLTPVPFERVHRGGRVELACATREAALKWRA